MYYEDYHFFGMHLIWWFVWGFIVFWIFFIPYDIPGQRKSKNSSLEILKKRFAAGQITKEKYEEDKKTLLS